MHYLTAAALLTATVFAVAFTVAINIWAMYGNEHDTGPAIVSHGGCARRNR